MNDLALATAAVDSEEGHIVCLQEHVFEGKGDQDQLFHTIFQPVLADFDVLITLHPDSVPHSGVALVNSLGLRPNSNGKVARGDSVGDQISSRRSRTVLSHIPKGESPSC